MAAGEARPAIRIALIHALAESVEPIHAAFSRHWPEAVTFDLLDTSLARDLAYEGRLDDSMRRRFVELARYAASTEGEGGKTAAILFTCSAFRPVIDAAKQAVDIPVMRPNEAAFEAALDRAGRIGLLVTFPPSQLSLTVELEQMAKARGVEVSIESRVVDGALSALKAGDADQHDALIAQAALQLQHCDSLVLGQFSMASAASAIPVVEGRSLLTTPDSAVQALRNRLQV